MTKSSKKPAAPKTAPAKAAKAAPASKAAAETASEKIGKTQLTELIADLGGISRKDAGTALTAALDVMIEALQAGKTVGLPGVGTLSVKATAARTGVRPGTSEKIQIAAGKKVSFKVASDLKKSL